MLHGLVPYKDLYEQKGPLLYMLHAVAAMFSETSFIGVYFFEIIAATVFLFFSFKIMKLYWQKIDICAVPIFAALVYSFDCFCHGDSAEELCLPLFAFAFYLVVRMLKIEQLPSLWELLIIGITSGFVLWIKFSMLGFYIGWFCVIAVKLFKQKNITYLLQAILCIAAGVLITSVPILIYFAVNRSLSDLWTAYFYNNLFHYSRGASSYKIISLFYNLFIGAFKLVYRNFLLALLVFIGMLRLVIKKNFGEFFSYLAILSITFLSVYAGGQSHWYYALIFCTFLPFGFVPVYKVIRSLFSLCTQNLHKSRFVRVTASVLVCLVSVCYAFAASSNTYLLKYSREELPQYQFAEIIKQDKNVTLLNYNFLDCGLYTTTGIVPNCKYFAKLNIDLKEMTDTQNEFINRGKVDYVVTHDELLNADNYECVATSVFYYEGTEITYRLYRLTEKDYLG